MKRSYFLYLCMGIAIGFIISTPASFAKTPLMLTDVSVSPDYASAGTGNITINYTIWYADNVRVIVTISNESGIISLLDFPAQGSGPHSISWNCRDNRGYLLSDGVYQVNVATEVEGYVQREHWTEFNGPRWRMSYDNIGGVGVNSTGYVYISTGDNQVFVVSPEGQGVLYKNVPAWRIAIGNDDSIYLTNNLGKYNQSLQLQKSLPYGKTRYNGVAYYPPDNLYVIGSDENGEFLKLFSTELVNETRIAGEGQGTGQIDGANCIAINSSGYVYVGELTNARVSIFTPKGQPAGAIRIPDMHPWAIAFDADDHAYIGIDYPYSKVVVFDRHGEQVGEIDVYTLAIAVGKNGRIYLSDSESVSVYDFGAIPDSVDSKTLSLTVDRTPPSISALSPLPGSGNLSPLAPITAQFNEALDPATVNANTFVVNEGQIYGIVAYLADTKTIRFEPAVALQPGGHYNATLTTGICDAAGSHFPARYTWNFTVKDPSAPTVQPAIPPTATPVATTVSGDGEWILIALSAIAVAVLIRGQRQP